MPAGVTSAASGLSLREALMGPAYYYHKRLIEHSKRWSVGEIERFQGAILRPLFAEYGNEVRDKDHYRNNLGKYDRMCAPIMTMTVHTGGTTGAPFAFKMDTLARRQKERAYLFDVWSEVGYRPFALRVAYRGNIGRKLISYNGVENCWTINPARLTKQTRQDLSLFLLRLKPFFLHVYPSSLTSLIDILGDAFRALPVRGVLAGSESFPSGQMKLFEQEYQLPIAHWYGQSEYVSFARYCRKCQGYHFYPTYGYTEFVPAGVERGHIVATSFNALGTRFVRYDTGDIAKLSARTCDCPFPRVDAIEGRQQEVFIDRDGLRRGFGPYLFGIHTRFWAEFTAIQFCQSSPGSMRVRVVPKDSSELPQLEAFLRDRFAPVDLAFDYVAAIPRTEAGKHQYYLNELHAGEFR
jgi:phenylacetate-CoA ligase